MICLEVWASSAHSYLSLALGYFLSLFDKGIINLDNNKSSLTVEKLKSALTKYLQFIVLRSC